MNQRPHLVPVPVTREPMSLLAVDRAVADLRRGQPVVIQGPRGAAALAMAAEAVTAERLAALARLARTAPVLALTSRRASVLGLADSSLKVLKLAVAGGLTPSLVHDLSDPLARVSLSKDHLLSLIHI